MELRYAKNLNWGKDFLIKADELIGLIISLNLPEIDVDQYHANSGVTPKDYATRKAQEFRSMAGNNPLEISVSSNNSANVLANKSPSTEECMSRAHSDGVLDRKHEEDSAKKS